MFAAFKKVSFLMLTLMLVFTSIASANTISGTKDQNNKKVTYIELTKEEAQQFEINNGGTLDKKIAGGTIVLDRELTQAQIKEYKEKLLKPRKDSKKQAGDVQADWCTGYYLSNVQYQ